MNSSSSSGWEYNDMSVGKESWWQTHLWIDSLVQHRNVSIAHALKILQPCTSPAKFALGTSFLTHHWVSQWKHIVNHRIYFAILKHGCSANWEYMTCSIHQHFTFICMSADLYKYTVFILHRSNMTKYWPVFLYDPSVLLMRASYDLNVYDHKTCL